MAKLRRKVSVRGRRPTAVVQRVRKRKAVRRQALTDGTLITRNTTRQQYTPFQRLLLDPCNGPLGSPYGGQVGNITRFDVDITVNTIAGHTSGYLFWSPGALVIQQAGGASSSIAQTNTGVNGPGSVFAPNMAQVRCVAACVTMIPSAASITTITGDVGAAVGSFNLVSGSSYIPDNLMQLCNARGVLERKAIETKWFASTSDDAYNSPGALNGGNNYLLIVWRGYPAGVALNFRFTSVLEWLPSAGIGLPQASAPRFVEPSSHLTQAAELHQQHPNWWTTIIDKAMPVVTGIAEGLSTKFLTYAGEAALAFL